MTGLIYMGAFEKLKQAVMNLTNLPNTEWNALEAIFSTKSYNKGNLLIAEGQTEKNIYYINKGITRNFFIRDGKEFTVDFHFEGDFVTAFYSLITKQPSTVAIELLEDTDVIVIPYSQLEEFYSQSLHGATIGRKMAELQYTKRLQKEMDLLSCTAEERYTRLIDKNPALVAMISVKHLSSFLGIQPESLSRIRRQYGRN
jgi:CRP-like cAMP-binding protein